MRVDVKHMGQAMRYLSTCSGIEAATVAWAPLGWEAAAFAEVEKFPSAVLAHHYPEVPNLGDMTAIKGDDYRGLVNLLVGGTPCQSFSVAGLRGGLDDQRGQLTLAYFRLAGRMRPRWVVWENVPGVLSDDGGRTFGAVLGALAELGYGFAYRILDAQWFGVPQRRRRVFLVGYLGDWRPAAAVLFERHSLSGDTPPSREARQKIAETITQRALDGGQGGTYCGGGNHYIPEIVSQAMSCKWAKGTSGPAGDEHHNLVAPPVTHKAYADHAGQESGLIPINLQIATRHNALGERTAFGIGYEGDPAYTITKTHSHGVFIGAQNDQPAAFQESQTGCREYDTAGTLRAGAQGMTRLEQESGWVPPSADLRSRNVSL